MTGFRVAPGGVQEREGVTARPDDARQDHRRRPAGRRLRRPGRHHGRSSRRTARSIRPARSRATRSRWPPGSRPCAALRDRRSTRISSARARFADGHVRSVHAGTACRTRPRSRGSMVGFFLTDGPVTNFSDAKRRHRALRALLPRHARPRRLPRALAVRGRLSLDGAPGAPTSTARSRLADDALTARICRAARGSV